jgi:hypothetical protein
MQTLETLLHEDNSGGGGGAAMVEVTDPKEEKRRIRKHRWASIIGLFAVVFLWRAIWDWSEIYFTTSGSFIIGLILIGIVGYLNKDHVRELF